MRVIAGVARGTRLGPVPPGTRPLSDRAREGLFSSLGERAAAGHALDLYAGTGALGIEALSRGAGRATFVDSSARAIATIHDNLIRTGLGGPATVVRSQVGRFLANLADPADLILLDPPYSTPADEVREVLERLAQAWLAPGGTAALTRPRRDYRDVIPLNWQVTRRLEYGDALVVCYRED